MEVGIRSGVCNNSPAEWIGPENGWRSPWGSYLTVKTRYGLTSRWALRSGRSFGANRNGPGGGADLGGSSKYSNENFED